MEGKQIAMDTDSPAMAQEVTGKGELAGSPS